MGSRNLQKTSHASDGESPASVWYNEAEALSIGPKLTQLASFCLFEDALYARVLAVIVSSLFLAGLPVLSQEDDDIPYTIELKDFSVVDRHEGIDALFIKVKFVVGVKGNARDHKNYKIHIFEDDKRIAIVDLPAPKPTGGLSVILAVDTSARSRRTGDRCSRPSTSSSSRCAEKRPSAD